MDVGEIRQAFVELWGSLASFWGVSPTTARVFGWLLSREDAADTDEMMAAMDLSRGSVSMACRELREWGLVSTEHVAGSRRMLFVPETDLERIVRRIVQIRKRREWDPILENLEDWIPQLEADSSPGARVFAQRLRSIQRLGEVADSFVELFLKGGTVSNVGLKLLVGGKGSTGASNSPRRKTS